MNTTTTCPDARDLLDYARSVLTASGPMEEHIGQCDKCARKVVEFRRVATVARAGSDGG